MSECCLKFPYIGALYASPWLELMSSNVALICQSWAGIIVIHPKCRLAMDENYMQIRGYEK